jgi:hypothetical protein
MYNAADILASNAQLYRERNSVYGDNYLIVGKVMSSLFPNGITLVTEDDHNRFHIMMLSVVKLTRYANNWNNGGHTDTSVDASVYWAMQAAIDLNIADKAEAQRRQEPAPKGKPVKGALDVAAPADGAEGK